MYGILRFHIGRHADPALFDYCMTVTGRSRNLRNAVLFRIRQWFTAYGKEELQPLQKEVIEEVRLTCEVTGRRLPKKVLNYFFLDKLMRVTENPDYFCGVPMQSAQAIVKETVNEFRSWLKALEAYKKDPSSFTGRPKMPGYTKADHRLITMTNQDCVIYRSGASCQLKLPLTKERFNVYFPDNAVLKEVKIRPAYGEYELILVYETKEAFIPIGADARHIGGIDLGVNNIAAFVSNDGEAPILYKGGAVKSMNRFFNRKKAELTGILMKGHDPKRVNVHTYKLHALSRKRTAFLRDEMHKISSHIIRECVMREIGTLVIGVNRQWKTKANMSKRSNQEFVSIPHGTLVHMIRYKAERIGISVIEQEESYTSKASFLDNDAIPVYGDEGKHYFSGRRISRGLYRSKDGTILSSDVNGSANILRKAYPDAFDGITDYGFLQKVKTVKFHELHSSHKPSLHQKPTCNPGMDSGCVTTPEVARHTVVIMTADRETQVVRPSEAIIHRIWAYTHTAWMW